MNKIKSIVETELLNLDKAIDYAEDNSIDRDYQFHDPSIVDSLIKIHSGQQRAYREFMRVAWGKAIRIKTEKQGEVVYRLSQAAAIIPGMDIATPQSPVGRLVNIARAGDIYDSTVLGEYSIEDVWYFERYVGSEYLENIKNFKKLSSQGKNVFSISNLFYWLNNIGKSSISAKGEEDIDIDISLTWDNVTFESSDDEVETPIIPEDIEEQNKISLPTGFYVNLTAKQYDATHSGPSGLVFVFGIAGSGKTSVALGRSKSLAQLGQLPKDDRLYNRDFPEETQIGIVRTSELISYLKDTCNMLSLHRLPIVEYREIYEELKTHWDIEQSRNSNKGPKFLLAQHNSGHELETRTKWFQFLSEAMLEVFSQKALRMFSSVPRSISSIDGDIFVKINEILTADIKHAIIDRNPLGYLSKIENATNKSIEKIFSQTVWIGIPGKEEHVIWYSDKHHDIANKLLDSGRNLCLFVDARNVQLIIPKAKMDEWSKWIPSDATYALQTGKTIPSNISLTTVDKSAIEFKVVIASNDELVQYAKIGTLRFYEGVGHRTQTLRTKKLWLAHMPRIVSSNEHQEGAEKNTREWRSKVRIRVLNNIKKSLAQLVPADLLSETIQYLADAHEGEYSALLKIKKQQIITNKLSENDIDLLIAFMASITRGIKKDTSFVAGSVLIPSPYRSSIFIDEVQDFSEIQILSLSLLADPKYNSITAVGDPAQCLYRTASDITVSFPENTWQDALKQKLTENIRQQHVPTLKALSSNFRNIFISDIAIRIDSYERKRCLNVFHRHDSIDQLRLTYKIISVITRKETVVIVVPSVERAKEAIKQLKPYLRERQHRECNYSTTIDLSKRYIAHVTTPKNIKGLEFDHLIALYLEEYDLNKTIDKNSLYVIMSRPKKELSLIGNFGKIRDDFRSFLEQFTDIQET